MQEKTAVIDAPAHFSPTTRPDQRLIGEPFAILDASDRSGSSNWSRLLTDMHTLVVCHNAGQIASCFGQIQTCVDQGFFVLGIFNYELAYGLHAPLAKHLHGREPLFRAAAFRSCELMHAGDMEELLSTLARNDESSAGIAALSQEVTEHDYMSAVERIQKYIDDGDCYQANFTFRLAFDYFGTPAHLYSRIRDRQKVGFGALIALPGEVILSFSPELFMRRHGNTLTVKPMKGTMPRGKDVNSDAALRAQLLKSEKDRAEHIMIVDLLRNDLGRLANTGSVTVDRLFEVETYQTLLQMTSTITAEIPANTSLHEIFSALFPCGSVTGAPKMRCMEILAEIEAGPRGVYCGAIGYIDPNGDFCFNVPIRTLVLDDCGRGTLGIGSGITHDSEPRSEYAECALKGEFLTGADPGFQLIETLRGGASKFQDIEHHLERLQTSARYFGFACDTARVRAALLEHAVSNALLPCKTRVLLGKEGLVSIESVPLTADVPSRMVRMSHSRTDSRDPLLRHKTTSRWLYDRELTRAKAAACFDAVFFNERGELTEGARSNVFLLIDGRWLTPPVSCGALPGIMRAKILADSAYGATEQVLYREDLARADRILLTNAVRGVVHVTLLSDSP
jgi:para-aminobenzoate synthetase/4-amino-4-deoxychorismate lyase